MMNSWRQTRMREVVDFYASGDPFLKLEYSDSGVPVLAKGDVKPFGRVEHGETRYVNESLVEARGYRITRPGDYLLTTRDLTQAADFLGLLAPIPEDRGYLVNQGANVIRFSSEVDVRYVVYWCNGPIYRAHIKGHFVGSTQIHLRKEDFLNAPLWLPPIPEQRAIAHILGTLDDKIELNRRMSQTLEEIARALFKSWFVDFDPVHAKAAGRQPAGMDAETAALFPSEFEESELGMIPKGWRVGSLGDVAINPRRSIRVSEIKPETPYIGLEHMPRRSIALTDWDTADGLESGKSSFETGEILFGKLRPYFHKVGVAPIDGVCSTDIVVVTAESNGWFGFVLGHIASADFVDFTNAGSTGTRMPRTSWKDMARYPIVIPTAELALTYGKAIEKLIPRINLAILESRIVGRVRDVLLPRLICGELSVAANSSAFGTNSS